jgi:hypothetical protein
MRGFNEITEDVRPEHTFSNLSSFEYWAARWCDVCRHRGDCPIVDAALLMEGAPTEWVRTDGPRGPFRCTEFIAE